MCNQVVEERQVQEGAAGPLLRLTPLPSSVHLTEISTRGCCTDTGLYPNSTRSAILRWPFSIIMILDESYMKSMDTTYDCSRSYPILRQPEPAGRTPQARRDGCSHRITMFRHVAAPPSSVLVLQQTHRKHFIMEDPWTNHITDAKDASSLTLVHGHVHASNQATKK